MGSHSPRYIADGCDVRLKTFFKSHIDLIDTVLNKLTYYLGQVLDVAQEEWFLGLENAHMGGATPGKGREERKRIVGMRQWATPQVHAQGECTQYWLVQENIKMQY